jgi:2'-5' RNA ligase
MLEQSSSPGFDPAPKPTDRLFFAIFPDAEAAARIAALARQLQVAHGLKGQPLQTARLHVTLHHLGDFAGLPPDTVLRARDAALAVAMPPFNVSFDRAASFRKPRNCPFVLQADEGVVAITAFQQALGAALKDAGLAPSVESSFTPHVTLLYDDCCVDEQPIEPIAWTAHEFVLVHSLIGRGVHVPLGRWPLQGSSAAAQRPASKEQEPS